MRISNYIRFYKKAGRNSCLAFFVPFYRDGGKEVVPMIGHGLGKTADYQNEKEE